MAIWSRLDSGSSGLDGYEWGGGRHAYNLLFNPPLTQTGTRLTNASDIRIHEPFGSRRWLGALHISAVPPSHLVERLGDLTQGSDLHSFHESGEGISAGEGSLLKFC